MYAGRAPLRLLLRMWLITLVLNAAGLMVFALIFAAPAGVLEHSALEAAGKLADTQGERAVLPALLSAIAAGTVMTLFTWVAAAAEDSTSRLLASLLIGFVLLAPASTTPSSASARSRSASWPGRPRWAGATCSGTPGSRSSAT